MTTPIEPTEASVMEGIRRGDNTQNFLEARHGIKPGIGPFGEYNRLYRKIDNLLRRLKRAKLIEFDRAHRCWKLTI